MMPCRLPEERWEEKRPEILDLYITQNKTLTRTVELMKRQGFYATRRMYTRHLEKWGIEKYLSEETKDRLCAELPELVERGGDISHYTPKLCKILLRHCKEKRPYADPKLLILLRSPIEASPIELRDQTPIDTFTSAISSQEAGVSPTDMMSYAIEIPQDYAEEQTMDTEGMDTSSGTEDYTEDASTAFFTDSDHEISSTSYRPTRVQATSNVDQKESDTCIQPLPPSLVNQYARIGEVQTWFASSTVTTQPTFRSRAVSLEQLLHLTQVYYTSQAERHEKALQLVTDDTVQTMQAESRSFWTSVKTAIYLFKKEQNMIPVSILRNIGNSVFTLCQKQPITLLREFLTTLSLANTKTSPTLRKLLLRLFATTAFRGGQQSSLLYRICDSLQEDWVCDEALTTVLFSIQRIATKTLKSDLSEAYEIQRAQIQLLRRSGDLKSAESMALTGQSDLEALSKGDSIHCRLMMSERLYILNIQHRTEEALRLAQDIVSRAQRDEGDRFPSRRTVYELEDLAEVYQQANNLHKAVHWLRVALQGAMNHSEDKGGMLHIHEKLTNLEMLLGGECE